MKVGWTLNVNNENLPHRCLSRIFQFKIFDESLEILRKMEGVDPLDPCQRFKINALKFQELISQTECLYDRRMTTTSNRDVVVKFVSSAIFDDQNEGYDDVYRECIENVVNLIVDANQSTKEKECSSDEIHYGIVYVLGYRINDGKVFKIPVFKAFTDNFNSEACFITIDQGFHGSWDSLLYYIGNSNQDFIISYPDHGRYSNTVLFTNVVNLNSEKRYDYLQNCMIEINLENVIRRIEGTPLNEGKVNGKLYKITEKFISTVGAISCEEALKDHLKIECFVDSVLFRLIIEHFKFQWNFTMFDNLATINEDELNVARNNALDELFFNADKEEILESFKYYWTDVRRLFFVNQNDFSEIYTFKTVSKGEAELKAFIHELIEDNVDFQKVDNGDLEYLRVVFKSSGDVAAIFFYEIFPRDFICFLIVPRFLIRENLIGNQGKPLTDTREILQGDDEINGATPMEVEESSVLPTDGKTLEFWEKAKQEQDFIAKTEGLFNHRILLKPDEDVLKQFVTVALLGFGAEDQNDDTKKKESKIINGIVKKIINENKKLDKHRRLPNEIHYGAVYVMGYKMNEKNEEKRMYKIPVFKIFKNKDDEDPMFIDVDLYVYQSWDKFLKTNLLPKSFFCVPKNGCYSLSRENEVLLEFKETPKYWSPARIASVTVSSAFLLGSVAFSFYTGPIGMGLALTLPVRLGIVGFGATTSVIGLGASLHKRQMRQVGNFVERYQHSISFVLNISLEVLAVYAEGSVIAGLATGVLASGSLGIGAYLIVRLTYDAILKFRDTGKIEMADIWNIINAALLFANGFLKFETVVNYIKSVRYYEKLPSFKQITFGDEDLTKTISNVGSVCKVFMDAGTNPVFEKAFIKLFQDSKEWWEGKKDLNAYQNDLIIFGGDIIQGVFELVTPSLKSFIYKKYKIDVDVVFGRKTVNELISSLQGYISKYFLYTAQKIQATKKQRQDIIKAIDDSITNSNGKISNIMNKGLEKAKTELTEKLVQDSDDKRLTLEKTMKAECYIETIVLKNEVERLKTCLGDSMTPNEKKIEDCINSAVDEVISEGESSKLQKQFEDYCKNDEKFILLEEDEDIKLYVFKFEGEEFLNDIVKKMDESFENVILEKVDADVYKYSIENKHVTLFLDREDPSDVVGYVLFFS